MITSNALSLLSRNLLVLRLCLNLPGNELPQKFSTGTSLYMNGGGAVGIVSTAREDWSPSMDSSAKIQEETTEITLRIKGHSEADTLDLCQPSQADWIWKYLEEQEEMATSVDNKVVRSIIHLLLEDDKSPK
ncbi:DExH-box ATP-dependent RNA helicase DExH7, chloroplastic-like [Actinidia eriantha]|uniref:DExH-box ATP-dependent RNA helicase DExH7, chloroplastic-like n=1 Tax=Actinidia eriantha TaxID=165200 RepID=UPI00258909B6|nr:DExH-box ATP-dependent RNA helicase DExH7, chloroplastic-like [Actinidia eriantha]